MSGLDSLILVLALALALFFVLARRCKFERNAQPSCGRCGYAAVNLPTWICPECGSDLKQVGVVYAQRRPLTVAVQLVMLTLVMISGFIFVANAFGPMLPQRVEWTSRIMLRSFVPGVNHTFFLSAATATWQRPPRWSGTELPNSVSPHWYGIELGSGPAFKGATNSSAHRIEIDAKHRTMQVYDQSGPVGAPQPYDRSAIAQWLTSVPLSPPRDPDAVQEMAAVLARHIELRCDLSDVQKYAQELHAQANGFPSLAFAGGTWGGGPTSQRWMFYIAIGLAGTIWIVVAYYLVRHKSPYIAQGRLA